MNTSLVGDAQHFQIKFVEILKGRRVKKSYFELIQKPDKVLGTFDHYQIAASQFQLLNDAFEVNVHDESVDMIQSTSGGYPAPSSPFSEIHKS